MITVLTGENDFEIKEALRTIIASFPGEAEQFDGVSLELKQLPDLLMGSSLFATQRLVVIHGLSENSHLWQKLPDWLSRLSDDIHVVLVEQKPDKRTIAYKALKEAAQIQEFSAWEERDSRKAEQWLVARAEQVGVTLDSNLAAHLVRRIGVNQWGLAKAIETISLLDVITIDAIDALIPLQPSENAFQLFETALQGNAQKVALMIQTLEQQDEAYAVFALLQSQAFSLAALTFEEGEANASKDFAIHPFVASKLRVHAKKLGKRRVATILDIFAKADADLKRSKAEPWLLVKKSLLEIAQ